MRGWVVGLAVSLAWVAGCSDSGKPKPVSISGDIKTSAGKPVTGVRLILEPVGGPTTSTIGFAVDAEGHFQGDALPGPYTFYLVPESVGRDEDGRPVNATEAKKLKLSEETLKGVPAAYHSAKGAGPERKVEVKSGATLALTVSP